MISPLRILHLEDDQNDAELISLLLEKEGFVCDFINVENRKNFIAAVDRHNFDIIFADFSLPSFNGMEALKIAQKKCSDIPFIFVSATLGEELAIESLKNGATDYVFKQRLSRLLPSVKRALVEFENKIELKKKEAQLCILSRAVEQSPSSVMITDPDGNIEYVNPKFTEITGYSSAEIIGKHPRIMSDKTADEKFGKSWDAIIAEKNWRGELHNKKKNGELFWISVSISPIKDMGPAITHFLVVGEDVNDRKQLETQFLHAQKMEAIGTLAGGIAHDFNNILTVINGYSGLLLQDIEENSKLRKSINEIKKAGIRAAALTNRLLAFSRRQILDMQKINLNHTINQMDDMLHRLMEKNVKLNIIFSNNPGDIIADEGQIEQVIMNLVINARDALPDGGSIIIKCENVNLNEDYSLKHISGKPGKYVMLSVSDTGIGMTKEVQNHIFEPFYTTKEVGKGTGLGLSTVYGIIKQCNGFISVNSEPDKGTTFNIYLPRVGEKIEGKNAGESGNKQSAVSSQQLAIELDH